MADLVTEIDGSPKLQFIIVPSGQSYTTPDNKTGLVIFREATKQIEVNGMFYGADNATQFSNLAESLTALKDAGLMTENNGVYTHSTPLTTGTTGIAFPEPDGGGAAPTSGTIAEFLRRLQDEITAINTTITNKDAEVYGAGSNGTSATTDASTAASSFTSDTTNKVVVKVTEVDGLITAVDVKTNDVASANDLTTLDNAAIKSVNGVSRTTGDTGAITIYGTDIAVSSSNNKTLSTVASDLVTLEGQAVKSVNGVSRAANDTTGAITIKGSDIQVGGQGNDSRTLDTIAGIADTAVQSVTLTSAGNNLTSTSNNAVTGALGAENIYMNSGTGVTGNKTIATAISDLNTAIGNTTSGATLSLYKVDGSSEVLLDGSTGLEKHIAADGSTYKLYQGGNNANNLIAEFNIEKDSFVKAGEVVRGSLSGSTWTADASGAYYIHLTIGTSDGNETDLYIPAESLVDAYTTGSGANDPVQIVVDNTNNQIKATFAIAQASQTGDVTTGAAAAVANVTKETYVKVSDSVNVTTQDGSVTSVSVGTQSVDAAGAAKAAYDDLLGASTDTATANTIYGAKAYAADAASTAQANAISHADSLITWTVVGAGPAAGN